MHDGRWRAVLASAGRPRLLDLAGAAEVEELVQRVRADLDALAMPLLPAPLLDAVRRSLEVSLRRLDDLLVAPLGVDGTPLVVSASAALTLMPWSLLPSRRGLPVVVTPGRPRGCGSGRARAGCPRGWWRWPGRGCTAQRLRRPTWARCGREPLC